MKNYYLINEEGQQEGPLSFEELKNLKISRDSFIWYEGLEEWKRAGLLNDFNSYFKLPPPFQQIAPPDFIRKPTSSISDNPINKEELKTGDIAALQNILHNEFPDAKIQHSKTIFGQQVLIISKSQSNRARVGFMKNKFLLMHFTLNRL
ncbi:DUF4339 domain-containing protein [Pontibacter sp. BAB1700]|uniref:DUF4339 domain-containing protein n=1 Tax=Pontibacter sp. BAB1700 TaxID=1144253 RepID=UPI00026BE42B|nr:DUF4339 domain-containing protein [Pontibacter sp. BAB1700]EJF08883.1 hypothetical protein O71_18246 [Pontibacter sp. BAB1700]